MPFTDTLFISAVERWGTIRETPLEHEGDFLFCGHMYSCFDDLDLVRKYFDTGQDVGSVAAEFGRAREEFYRRGIDEYINDLRLS